MKKNYRSLLIFIGFLLCTSCGEKPAPAPSQTEGVWWKEGIIYQLYPRSFKDSNGDGVGDLRGIIQELDYLKSLGVDIVWLNPIYSSPNDDNGYDISDYRDIMTEFGTLADFDELLRGFHDRGIRVVMDLVVNHSSDEHAWFKQSRSSRDNPYRDYYHWWPAEKGKPNYRYSLFDETGNAWLFDSTSNAYYLHYFSRKQPDLNWENPKVRQEVYDIMKFWIEKGIDGFRLDAFQFVSKDTAFPPLPKGFETQLGKYYGMGPHLHDYLREMNREVLSQHDVMAVSEGAGSTFEDAHNLVDDDRRELQMVYHFEGMDIGNSLDRYQLADFKNLYTRWDSAFAQKGWLSIFLANHDQPRMVSKFGDDRPEFRAASSKMLNTFILSMRGTPYCYYGDELGMTNIDFARIEDFKDNATISTYRKAVREGADSVLLLKKLNFLARDNGRTPMQWNAEAQAGFTTGIPWLRVNPNYVEINVAAQNADPNSCLNYFRKMVRLRKENPVLVYGAYRLLLPEHKQVYAYTRTLGDKKMLVLLNFSADAATAELPSGIEPAAVLINNYEQVDRNNSRVQLAPYQAVIFSLK